MMCRCVLFIEGKLSIGVIIEREIAKQQISCFVRHSTPPRTDIDIISFKLLLLLLCIAEYHDHGIKGNGILTRVALDGNF